MKQYSFHSCATLLVVSAILMLHSASAGEGHHKCMDAFKKRAETEACCSKPWLLEMDDNAEKCVKSCKDEGKDLRECFSCCAKESFEKLGYLDGDSIKESALQDKAATFEGSWAATNKEMITECMEKINKMKERHGEHGGQCDPAAAMFSMCIGKKTIQKCPEWTESDHCNLVKQCAEMKPPRKQNH